MSDDKPAWDGDLTKTVGCWNPPCIESTKRGGAGCTMCDVNPRKYPQQRYDKKKDMRVEEPVPEDDILSSLW